MTEENNEILTLLDEEGQEHSFVVLDVLNVNDKEYAILLPAGDMEGMETGTDTGADGPEAIVFRIEETTEGQSLLVVEDEQELEEVARAWEEAYEGEDYDEEDEDYED